jgi:hypothetical protein
MMTRALAHDPDRDEREPPRHGLHIADSKDAGAGDLASELESAVTTGAAGPWFDASRISWVRNLIGRWKRGRS